MTATAVLAHLLRKLRSKNTAIHPQPKPSTAPSLDSLDDAALAHLLSLLPLPDLCRARALSRRFCNLIHLRRLLHSRRLSALLLPGCSVPASPFFPLPPESTLLASAPGVLLLHHHRSGDLIVLDPVSNNSAQIPPPKRGSFPNPPIDMCLGVVSDFAGGLADFKVVSGYVEANRGGNGAAAAWGSYRFEIFFSEHGEWLPLKKTSAEVAAKFGTTHEGGVLIGGSMHWLGRFGGDCHVLALDLRRGTARKMQVPAVEGGIGWLGAMDGSLSVGRVSGAVLEVWRLIDYLNVRWSRICQVRFGSSPWPAPARLLGFYGSTAVMATAAKRVVGYDIEKKEWGKEELGQVTGERQWAVPLSVAPVGRPHWDEDWVVIPADEMEKEAAAMKEFDMLASFVQE